MFLLTVVRLDGSIEHCYPHEGEIETLQRIYNRFLRNGVVKSVTFRQIEPPTDLYWEK